MSAKMLSGVINIIAVTMYCFSLQVISQTKMTSEFFRKTADSLAITHSADAQLALVSCLNMDTTGKSDTWTYVYLSADSIKEYQFQAQNNQVIFDSSFALRVGIGVLVSPWINSDSALALAEKAGGTIIRRRFPTSNLMASLSRPVVPSALCYWQIDYQCSDSTRIIVINATGIATSVNDNTIKLIPKQFELYQNYPDPFNPTTTLSFTIPLRSSVSLKVFDILGREVATIISGEMPAGTYSRQWNATKMSSGIYFYRLRAGSFTQTKRLVLLK